MSHDPSAPQPWQPPPGVQSWQPPPATQQPSPGPPEPWQPPPDWLSIPPQPPPKKRSWLVVVAGFVGGVIGLVSLGGAVLYLLGVNSLGQRVEFGRGEEVYFKGVSKQEAERLGKVLQEVQYFNNQGAKTVQLLRRDGLTVVNLVVRQGTWDQQNWVDECAYIGLLLEVKAFPGTPLEVGLCDERMKVRRTIAIEPTARMMFGRQEELDYSSHLKQEAEQLGKALQRLRVFDDTGHKSVLLRQKGDTLVIHFVILANQHAPPVVAELRQLGARLRQEVFPGRRVELALCDDKFVPRNTLPIE